MPKIECDARRVISKPDDISFVPSSTFVGFNTAATHTDRHIGTEGLARRDIVRRRLIEAILAASWVTQEASVITSLIILVTGRNVTAGRWLGRDGGRWGGREGGRIWVGHGRTGHTGKRERAGTQDETWDKSIKQQRKEATNEG